MKTQLRATADATLTEIGLEVNGPLKFTHAVYTDTGKTVRRTKYRGFFRYNAQPKEFPFVEDFMAVVADRMSKSMGKPIQVYKKGSNLCVKERL